MLVGERRRITTSPSDARAGASPIGCTSPVTSPMPICPTTCSPPTSAPACGGPPIARPRRPGCAVLPRAAAIITDLAHLGDVPTLDPRGWRVLDTPLRSRPPVAVSIDLVDEDHFAAARARPPRDRPALRARARTRRARVVARHIISRRWPTATSACYARADSSDRSVAAAHLDERRRRTARLIAKRMGAACRRLPSKSRVVIPCIRASLLPFDPVWRLVITPLALALAIATLTIAVLAMLGGLPVFGHRPAASRRRGAAVMTPRGIRRSTATWPRTGAVRGANRSPAASGAPGPARTRRTRRLRTADAFARLPRSRDSAGRRRA